MKIIRRVLGFASLAAAVSVCSAAEQKNADVVELSPWKHEYYWKEFTLSKGKPTSDDGRYRLKSVGKNGVVQLFYSETPEDKEEMITVKPMPKEFKQGVRPPPIVVKAFDSAKQLATIRELRMK